MAKYTKCEALAREGEVSYWQDGKLRRCGKMLSLRETQTGERCCPEHRGRYPIWPQ